VTGKKRWKRDKRLKMRLRENLHPKGKKKRFRNNKELDCFWKKGKKPTFSPLNAVCRSRYWERRKVEGEGTVEGE